MPESAFAAMIEPQAMEMAALTRRQSRAFVCVESLFCLMLPLLALRWTGSCDPRCSVCNDRQPRIGSNGSGHRQPGPVSSLGNLMKRAELSRFYGMTGRLPGPNHSVRTCLVTFASRPRRLVADHNPGAASVRCRFSFATGASTLRLRNSSEVGLLATQKKAG